MSTLEKLQKHAFMGNMLRRASIGLRKGVRNIEQSIANKGVKDTALTYGGKALGAGLGLATAAAIPGTVKQTYNSNKIGFNPAVHNQELGV